MSDLRNQIALCFTSWVNLITFDWPALKDLTTVIFVLPVLMTAPFTAPVLENRTSQPPNLTSTFWFASFENHDDFCFPRFAKLWHCPRKNAVHAWSGSPHYQGESVACFGLQSSKSELKSKELPREKNQVNDYIKFDQDS